MKKKLFTLGITIIAAISLVACGDKDKSSIKDITKNSIEKIEEQNGEDVSIEAAQNTEDEEAAIKDEEAYKKLLTPNEYDSIDYSKYIELSDYKTSLDTISIEPATEEEIQAEIDAYLSYNSTYEEIKEGNVKNGDIINVDITTKIEDTDISELSGSQLYFQIGEASLGEDFDKNILDAKIGEEIIFTGTLPEDIETYGNKTATFTVIINYIQGKEILPEFNDEFVKSLTYGEYTKADDFKKYIEDYINENKAYNTIYEVIGKITEESTFTDIDEFVDKEYKETYQYYEDYAKSMSVEFNEFVQIYMGLESVEEFETAVKESTTSIVKQKLTVYAICEKENIVLTDEEYKSYADEFVEKYGYNSVADLVETEGASYLRSYCLIEKLVKQYL